MKNINTTEKDASSYQTKNTKHDKEAKGLIFQRPSMNGIKTPSMTKRPKDSSFKDHL